MENSYKNIKILIIDDEELMCEALVDKFDSEGFSTLSARDGDEGLEIALKEHPDLILLDILMPKMDGLTMLKKLREDGWGQDVPVILLTNADEHEKMIEGTKNWAKAYLVKSDWKLEDVVRIAKNKLNIS